MSDRHAIQHNRTVRRDSTDLIPAKYLGEGTPSEDTVLFGDRVWRDSTSIGGGGVTDHGALTGLADDDHPGHPWLAGRSGGQALYGGTTSADSLTLYPTQDSSTGTVYTYIFNPPVGSGNNVVLITKSTATSAIGGVQLGGGSAPYPANFGPNGGLSVYDLASYSVGQGVVALFSCRRSASGGGGSGAFFIARLINTTTSATSSILALYNTGLVILGSGTLQTFPGQSSGQPSTTVKNTDSINASVSNAAITLAIDQYGSQTGDLTQWRDGAGTPAVLARMSTAGVLTAKSVVPSYVAVTADPTLTAAHHVVDITANTFTIALPAAATAGAGKTYVFKNSGAGVVTLDGSGSETIDGAATLDLNSTDSATLVCTGSAWIAV